MKQVELGAKQPELETKPAVEKPSKRELEIEEFKKKLRPFSIKCFNCDNKDWGPCYPDQFRKYIFATNGGWFSKAQPAHNKRKCKNCGAKWLEELGNFQ